MLDAPARHPRSRAGEPGVEARTWRRDASRDREVPHGKGIEHVTLKEQATPHRAASATTAVAPGVRRRRTIPLTGPIALVASGGLIALGVIAGIIGSWTTGAIERVQLRADLMLICCTVGALLTFAGMMWWLDRRAAARHEVLTTFLVGQYAALARQVQEYEQTAERAGEKFDVNVEEIIRQASAGGYLRGVQARLGGGGGQPRFRS